MFDYLLFDNCFNDIYPYLIIFSDLEENEPDQNLFFNFNFIDVCIFDIFNQKDIEELK